MDLTDRQLCPFRITARLGAGGMGTVYRARDTRFARAVARKVLADDLAGDPELVERFDRPCGDPTAFGHGQLDGL